MKKPKNKGRIITLLIILCIGFSIFSCSKTVYVRQNGTSYNDYEAMKHRKIIKKDTKKPKTYTKKLDW